MICLTHLELCPHCKRIALKVCEYSKPYPRVEAECQCCGYRVYDKPMSLSKDDFKSIFDKLGNKMVGSQCIDDRCSSNKVIKLLSEGSYAEYRCLECGAEWNTEELKRAVQRVKDAQNAIKNGDRLLNVLKASEGECPLCGWDIGHLYSGYATVVECFVCGYHNIVEEHIPEVDLAALNCAEYEHSEEAG